MRAYSTSETGRRLRALPISIFCSFRSAGKKDRNVAVCYQAKGFSRESYRPPLARSNRDAASLNASTLDISRSLPFSTFALKARPLDRSPRERERGREPVHFESNHLSGASPNMHFKETPNWLEVMAPEARAIAHTN